MLLREELQKRADTYKSLQHSSQYGKQHYNKIENYYPDGRTRYFWTKAEWDAYQEGLKRTKWEEEQKKKKLAENVRLPESQPNKLKDINENNLPKINVQNEQAKKLMSEVTEQEKKNEATKRAGMEGYEEWAAKKREERKKKAEAAGKAGMTGYEDWYKETGHRKEVQNRIKANLKKVSGAEELKKAQKEINERKVTELKDKGDYVGAYKLENSEDIKDNSEWLLNDDTSPLSLMDSILDYEVIETEEDFNKLVQDYEDGTYFSTLLENDKKIDNIYQWIAENKETEEVDPNNGLKIKNYDLPIEEEMKIVNPGYYYSDQEYDWLITYNSYPGPTGYANNCYACTQAMALRKQGYDVTPGTDLDGAYSEYWNHTGEDVGTPDPELGMAYNDLWTGSFSNYDNYSNTNEKMSKEPVGSYGDFNFEVFDGMNWMGHSIFYEVTASGEVTYYDCQNGMIYDEAYMKELKSTYKEFHSRYKRLDNQTFKGAENMKKAKKISKAPIDINIKGGISK